MSKSQYIVTEKEHLVSLRNFIKKKHEEYTTRAIEKLLHLNGCLVNQKVQRFGSTKLKEGDSIQIFPQFLDRAKEVAIPILYQDEDLIVINKPAGVSSVVKDLKPYLKKDLFLVHRLDKMTSGILILALNEKAQKAMEQLFFNREIEKTYLAVTHGRLSSSRGEIDKPIALKKRYQGGVLYQTVPFGKKAITEYQRLALSKTESFVLLKPITGRTHQIRVHLSSLGHPIVGDAQYTEKSVSTYQTPTLLLHAYKISFIHPMTGKNMTLVATLPPTLKKAVSRCFQKHKICAF